MMGKPRRRSSAAATQTRIGLLPNARRRASLGLLLVLLAACTSPSLTSHAPLQPEIATGFTRKADMVTRKFAVAAANPLATQAGFDILKAGGSAVDAAIAVQMAVSYTHLTLPTICSV